MDLGRFQNLDMIVVCGLPGSGKSHFAGAHFAGTGRLRVNRKEMRRLLFEMTHFGQKWSEKEFASSDEFLVGHVERKIIEHFLQGHKKLLIDNTSMSRGIPQALPRHRPPGGEEHRRDLPRYARRALPRAQQVPGGFHPREGHLEPRGGEGASRRRRGLQGSHGRDRLLSGRHGEGYQERSHRRRGGGGRRRRAASSGTATRRR